MTFKHNLSNKTITALIVDIGSSYCRMYVVKYTSNKRMEMIAQGTTREVSGTVIDEVLKSMCEDTINSEEYNYMEDEKKVIYNDLVTQKEYLSDERMIFSIRRIIRRNSRAYHLLFPLYEFGGHAV